MMEGQIISSEVADHMIKASRDFLLDVLTRFDQKKYSQQIHIVKHMGGKYIKYEPPGGFATFTKIQDD